MKKMFVAMSGLTFNAENKLNELTFNLPEGTEILSVSVEEISDEYTLWFNYLTPSDAYDDFKKYSYPWKKFHFFIAKCNFAYIEIDEHKYIGNVDIDGNTFAVFYKVGETIKE